MSSIPTAPLEVSTKGDVRASKDAMRAFSKELNIDSRRQVRRLMLLSNFRAPTGPRGAGSSGYAFEVHRDVPVADLEHYIGGATLGGRISVIPLAAGNLDNLSMREWSQRAQSAGLADALREEDDDAAIYSLETGDTVPWAVELGNRSHFCGLFAHVDGRRSIGDAALVTHTGADAQSAALLDAAKSNGLTVGELAEHDGYRRLQDYADRNNRAVAARVAELLGIRKGVEVVVDREQFLPSQYHEQRPLIAPHYSMARYGVIVPCEDNDDYVRVYNRVVALPSTAGSDIALPLGPLTGVAHYRFGSAVRRGDDRIKLLHNTLGDAVPVGAPTMLAAESPAQMTPQQRDEILQRLWWLNKGASVANDDGIAVRMRRAPSDYNFDAHFGDTTAPQLSTQQLVSTHLEPIAVLVSGR